MALPAFVGFMLLDLTMITSGSAVKKYRAVVFDNTTGTDLASGGMGKIKAPTAAHTDGEVPMGVCYGPVGPESLDPATPNPAIAANKSVQVRVAGVAVVEADASATATPIIPGDWAALSNAAGYEGCIKKAALTNGLPDANQHILGLSFSRVATNSTYGLVRVQSGVY